MRLLALCAFVTLAACAAPAPVPIEFLTREGCVQTTIMRVRLDGAITAIGKPIPYTVVDLDTLVATDARKGYPTPTILIDAKDMFGMEPPAPPFPAPT